MHESGIEVLLEMNFQPTDNPNLIRDCLVFWVREYHVDGFRYNTTIVIGDIINYPDICALALKPRCHRAHHLLIALDKTADILQKPIVVFRKHRFIFRFTGTYGMFVERNPQSR